MAVDPAPRVTGAPDDAITFIGTATVLIRFGGFTVLTDPNFIHRGERVGIGYGLSVRRRTEPAMDIDQLPPLDLVVLSHLHGDHFDQVAEKRLDKSVPIVSTRLAAKALGRKGFEATEGLRTWQTHTMRAGARELCITAMPGRHAPGALSALAPPVMGSLLEFRSADQTRLRIYISGDTLIHDALNEIPRRYPAIDLALLHLGGTRLGVLKLTMDAQDGVQAVRLINAGTSIPIHYDDYPIFRSRLDEFQRAVTADGLDDRVHYLHRGDHFPLPPRGGGGRSGAGLDLADEPAIDPVAAERALTRTADAPSDYGLVDAARETDTERDLAREAWAQARADEATDPLEGPRDRG